MPEADGKRYAEKEERRERIHPREAAFAAGNAKR